MSVAVAGGPRAATTDPLGVRRNLNSAHVAGIQDGPSAVDEARARTCDLVTSNVGTFEDLGVDTAVVKALANAGITEPFPIQQLSLPMALTGADLIGQARTGTGKTLAFGIPLVQRVDPHAGHTQALVVVPTRELCLQVHDDLVTAGATRKVRIVAAYGGRAIEPQSEAIAAGAPIVVGTPGRLLDLCRRRLLDLSRVTALVLDEADEMLDMGFLPDVEQLIERCPSQRQTLLFSATMPSEVVRLARRYMDKPTFMRSEVEQLRIGPQTRQHFFACHRLDKPAVVARILGAPGRGRTLIFTRTKRMADVLASELRDRKIDAGVIHSDLRQDARERSLARFRSGTHDVLCATEVAARGLDIDQVTHVINYDCPDDERMYLHRIGRTGRAGAEGVAITLAVWNELARLDMIKRALDIDQPTHEVLSTTPMLDDLFGSPGDGSDGSDRSDESSTSPTDREADVEQVETAAAGTHRGDRRPRSRSRRRRRRPRTATADGRSGTAADAVPAQAEPDGAARTTATVEPVAEAARARDQEAARTEAAIPEVDSAKTNRRRRRGRGSRRSGRDDSRRPVNERGDAGPGSAASGSTDEAVRQTADNPRGEGKPMLNRPLHITHLP